MATIVRRGKKWYAVYKDRQGRQVWKAAYTDQAESKRLANRLADDEKKIADGLVDPAEQQRAEQRRLHVESHIAAYETHLQAAQRRPNHIAYTIADIRSFVAHSGVTTLPGVTRATVDAWVIALSGLDEKYRQSDGKLGKANSARTINRRVGSLQAFLRWAKDAGAVAEYKLRKYPKREVRGKAIRKARALTGAEQAKLLRWAKRNAPERHDLYLVALRTGLRLEEIKSLTAENFDLKGGSLTVHSKDPRHTNRVDTVPTGNEVLAVVRRRLKVVPAGGCLFRAEDHAAEQLREDCTAAGVDAAQVNFHGLRHSFITSLAVAGVHPTIASKLARHRDISMTLGYYTHWATEDEREALSRLGVTA